MSTTASSKTIVLGDLLVRSEMTTPRNMADAVPISLKTGLPIGRALIAAGALTENHLQQALVAQSLIRDSLLSTDLAIQALRIVVKEHFDLEQALNIVGWHREIFTSENRLGQLLLEAGVVSDTQLEDCLRIFYSAGLPLARVLVLKGVITNLVAYVALTAQQMLREKKLSREQAIQSVQAAKASRGVIERDQVDGYLRLQPINNIRLGELFVRANLVEEDSLIRAVEESIAKGQTLGEILVGQGFITEPTLARALEVQRLVTDNMLDVAHAGDVLKKADHKRVNAKDMLDHVNLESKQSIPNLQSIHSAYTFPTASAPSAPHTSTSSDAAGTSSDTVTITFPTDARATAAAASAVPSNSSAALSNATAVPGTANAGATNSIPPAPTSTSAPVKAAEEPTLTAMNSALMLPPTTITTGTLDPLNLVMELQSAHAQTAAVTLSKKRSREEMRARELLSRLHTKLDALNTRNDYLGNMLDANMTFIRANQDRDSEQIAEVKDFDSAITLVEKFVGLMETSAYRNGYLISRVDLASSTLGLNEKIRALETQLEEAHRLLGEAQQKAQESESMLKQSRNNNNNEGSTSARLQRMNDAEQSHASTEVEGKHNAPPMAMSLNMGTGSNTTASASTNPNLSTTNRLNSSTAKAAVKQDIKQRKVQAKAQSRNKNKSR